MCIYSVQRYKWLYKTQIYKLINFYSFKLSEKFVEKQVIKFYLVRINLSERVYTLKRVYIFALNVAVFVIPNLNGYILFV